MVPELPPIWVVSLERAADRRRFMEQTFAEASLPYEIIPAVDARELSSDHLAQYSSRRAMYHYSREVSRGLFAATLSHLRALERMVSENIPELVVFEDDTRPLPGFVDLLRSRDRLPVDYDVITFNSQFDWASPVPVGGDPISDGFRVCRYQRTPMGLQAYLITRRAARHVLDVAYPVCLPPDELLFRPRPAGLRVYGIEPSPVEEADFPTEARAPAPPIVTHAPLPRSALEVVRFIGRARRRLAILGGERRRAAARAGSSQRSDRASKQ